MMRHRTSSLFFATTVMLGLSACGGSQSQANAPSNANMEPASAEPSPQSGAMSQQANEAPSMSPDPARSSVGGRIGATGAPGPNTMNPVTTGSAPRTWGGEPSPPPGAEPPSGSEPPSSTAPQYGATSATSGGAADLSGLNDGQLVAIVRTVNQSEIEQGQLGQTKATSPAVKRFAQHMVSAHRALMSKDSAVLLKTGIRPSDNAVSNQLKTDAENQLSMLQAVRGREFDAAYVEAQVRGHNQALELLDRVTQNVKNPDFKSEWQGARSEVEDHLREAERLQQELQSGTTSTQPASGSGSESGSSAGTHPLH